MTGGLPAVRPQAGVLGMMRRRQALVLAGLAWTAARKETTR